MGLGLGYERVKVAEAFFGVASAGPRQDLPQPLCCEPEFPNTMK